MDILMLLAPATTSFGYEGRGDFAMDGDGRLRRRASGRSRPFRLCRRRDREAGTLPRHARRRLLGQPPSTTARSRSRPPATACASTAQWLHVGEPRRSLKSAEECHRRERALTPMSRLEPRVFSIPPALPFLPTLVDALLDGRLVGDASRSTPPLADATIYLPTRRAARALVALLAERGGGAGAAPAAHRARSAKPTRPSSTDRAPSNRLRRGRGAAQPPIPPLERRLILTRLVQRWSAAVDRDLLPLAPRCRSWCRPRPPTR